MAFLQRQSISWIFYRQRLLGLLRKSAITTATSTPLTEPRRIDVVIREHVLAAR